MIFNVKIVHVKAESCWLWHLLEKSCPVKRWYEGSVGSVAIMFGITNVFGEMSLCTPKKPIARK